MLKKGKVWFLLLFLLFGTYEPPTAVDGIAYSQTSLYEQLPLQSSELISQLVILPNETYNEKAVESIVNRLDRLSPQLLERINHEQIKLKLFVGSLTEQKSASHLVNVQPRGYEHTALTWDDVPGIGGSKIVLVKIGHSDQGMGHGSVNLELHELAHSIQRYVYNDISIQGEFLSIWKEEVRRIFPKQPYFINFPEEYFAETFAMFYYNEETKAVLKEKAPKTFSFFKKLENL
jgi:Pro-Pro endopeptidase